MKDALADVAAVLRLDDFDTLGVTPAASAATPANPSTSLDATPATNPRVSGLSFTDSPVRLHTVSILA